MSDENDPTPTTAYPKTGLIIGATVLPILGWAARQVYVGAMNALNSKPNFVPEDED